MADKLDQDKRKLNMLRETNSNIINEIEGLGQGMELTLARLEHFTVFLVEIGLITEQQLIDSNLTWERNLKEQLVPIVQALRERHQEHMLRQQQEARQRKIEERKEGKGNKPTRVMLDSKPQGVNDPAGAIIIPGV